MRVRHASAAGFVLAIAGLAVGCNNLPGKPVASEQSTVSGRVMDFDGLFRSNCAGCHGADGRDGAAPLLNSSVVLTLYDADTLRDTIAHGVPGTSMPGFAQSSGGTLNDQQIAVISDEMRTRWARPAELQGTTPPPLVEATPSAAAGSQSGADAYKTFCARCHGDDGNGGPHGGSVVDPVYLGLVSDRGLRTVVIAGRPDLGHPDWRGYVEGRPMTAQEVTDVVAWLVSHRRK